MLINSWTFPGWRALAAIRQLCHRRCSTSDSSGEALQLTLAIIKPHIVKDPYSLHVGKTLA